MGRRISTLRRYLGIVSLNDETLTISGHKSSYRRENVRITLDTCLTSTNDYTSTSWYKPGQTPGSVLGEVSSSMEECRAETVSLYCNLADYPFYTELLLYFYFSGRQS
jgi:Peptidase family M49